MIYRTGMPNHPSQLSAFVRVMLYMLDMLTTNEERQLAITELDRQHGADGHRHQWIVGDPCECGTEYKPSRLIAGDSIEDEQDRDDDTAAEAVVQALLDECPRNDKNVDIELLAKMHANGEFKHAIAYTGINCHSFEVTVGADQSSPAFVGTTFPPTKAQIEFWKVAKGQALGYG